MSGLVTVAWWALGAGLAIIVVSAAPIFMLNRALRRHAALLAEHAERRRRLSLEHGQSMRELYATHGRRVPPKYLNPPFAEEES